VNAIEALLTELLTIEALAGEPVRVVDHRALRARRYPRY
jgi:hypothetical protein